MNQDSKQVRVDILHSHGLRLTLLEGAIKSGFEKRRILANKILMNTKGLLDILFVHNNIDKVLVGLPVLFISSGPARVYDLRCWQQMGWKMSNKRNRRETYQKFITLGALFATDATGVFLPLAPEPSEEDSVVNAIFAIAAYAVFDVVVVRETEVRREFLRWRFAK
jgi:hypothetical protein